MHIFPGSSTLPFSSLLKMNIHVYLYTNTHHWQNPGLGLTTRRTLKGTGSRLFQAGKLLFPLYTQCGWGPENEQPAWSPTESKWRAQTQGTCGAPASPPLLPWSPETRPQNLKTALHLFLPFQPSLGCSFLIYSVINIANPNVSSSCCCSANSLLRARFSPGVRTPCSLCKCEHVGACVGWSGRPGPPIPFANI